ncbi:hypothetical protein CY34DRAFT_489628 [Suillus luteus UH-Slu-Lm8-n1]|uniref:Uncharacterized protein n=1 Tax=Suillus luteus UH-Slu-Lm8-n1 TaxID=930992 RepID=A0A0D0A5K9_9AGAM|nr:hypothetical protein CY34DRAFT_489628 [Suillus luteus UH-Slu-Lm8-n1]
MSSLCRSVSSTKSTNESSLAWVTVASDSCFDTNSSRQMRIRQNVLDDIHSTLPGSMMRYSSILGSLGWAFGTIVLQVLYT